jgi:hypothetical protein
MVSRLTHSESVSKICAWVESAWPPRRLTLGDSGGDQSIAVASPLSLPPPELARRNNSGGGQGRWRRGSPSRACRAVRGCEEGDGGLLRRVVQAAEVVDLASVSDGGRCGDLKGWRAGGVRSGPRKTSL